MGKVLYPVYPLLSQLKDPQKLRLIVHDLEEKIFYFIVPISVIVAFTVSPFIHLWIGRNVEVISISIIGITCAYLLGSITILPNYQYLMAKNHASKTIILQSANVFFNTVIFFATYLWLGYYSAILANMAAIFSSFSLSLYYQKKYLNSLIFDDVSQVIRLGILAGINIIAGLVICLFIKSYFLTLILTLLSLSMLSLLSYRYLELIKTTDVIRYLGNNNRISQLVVRTVCRT